MLNHRHIIINREVLKEGWSFMGKYISSSCQNRVISLKTNQYCWSLRVCNRFDFRKLSFHTFILNADY